MMEKFTILLAAALLLCLLSLAAADEGTATYYTPITPSTCYGFGNEGTMIASASDEIWSNGSACGRRYRVTCIGATNDGAYPCNGNSVEVTIVDYCPSPSCPATMELSREAFGAIANLDAGKIRISFVQI